MALNTDKIICNTKFDNIEPSRVRSINLHITNHCNYRCRFCFAHFYNTIKQIPEKSWTKILEEFAKLGTDKVTFVGGEPTLVDYLPKLLKKAKDLGMTTMVITNGSKINQHYLYEIENVLDWMGISIDSGIEDISRQLGRGSNHVQQTIEISKLLYERGIQLKINTVVTSRTWNEDMNWLLEELLPRRWKVFQMLPIQGENDGAADLLIDDYQFKTFIETHKVHNPVWESNTLMRGSYVMVDPLGRLFDNVYGMMRYSAPILDVGLEEALSEIEFDMLKFKKRGGMYKW
ncbi:MAG: radical SAM protein [Candidatus Heimdallarchaeota archaeon]|nr:radical SAM protein [Candidatus Heimdallarchaeota archaeon]